MQTDAKFWNERAARYAASPVRDMDAYSYTLDRTRSYLRRTNRVLELGCGTGTTALELAKNAQEIVATDLSEQMLQIARDKARAHDVMNVAFHASDALVAEIDGPFDVVMAFNLLHLLPDLEAVLARAYELLPEGGLFISKTPCPTGPDVPLKFRAMLLALPVMQWFGKAPYVQFYTIPQLEAAVSWAGFQIIETGNFPLRPPSRYIVARKL